MGMLSSLEDPPAFRSVSVGMGLLGEACPLPKCRADETALTLRTSLA